MNLPNYEKAIVPKPTITEYLLSETHLDGRHKAAFFRKFGYTSSDWERLRDDLLKHAELPVTAVEHSPFGMRYVVEGIIYAPDGRQPRVRTVWFIEHGMDVPRLATAYPTD